MHILKTKLRKDFHHLLSSCFLLAILLPVVSRKAAAQSARFAYAHYVQDRDTLLYRIVHPDYDTTAQYPLVIFLHGSGERGNDNKAQLKWGVLNFATDEMMVLHPAIVVAPQCPKGERWGNFTGFSSGGELKLQPQPTTQMKLVIGLIHHLIKTDRVDTNRIYITGLSMGGLGTYDAIERYPNLFAAALPVAGGGDPSFAHRIVNLPLWDFHGAKDAAVNPKYSRDMIESLWKLGGHPGYTEYPDVGHFSWLAAYSDPQVLAWLFKQHK